MKKLVLHLLSTLRLRAYSRYSTFPLASYLCVSAFICGCVSSVIYASPPPTNDEFFCVPFDYEDIRARDSLYAATKQALDLDVGEPRTVRMIYFLPNDRPFQQEVVDRMKVTIREIQTFYADQMEAHGYGRKTFRFENDAQGDPVVHRVDGGHPNSYYWDGGRFWDDIPPKFDFSANNVYLTVWDNGTGSIDPGVAGSGGGGRDGGSARVSDRFGWSLVAHELGHTFGLGHDWRDGNYIMSYGAGGSGRHSLSACAAEFLSVHPYFNPDIRDEETPPPTIELISSPEYPTGSTSVSIQLKVSDPDGLHQVLLFASTGLKACRSLNGETSAVVQFDYDGVIPASNDPQGTGTSLSDPLVHPFSVRVVDTGGNTDRVFFSLWDVAIRRNAIAILEEDNTAYSLAFSSDGTTLATGRKLWDIATQTELATPYGNIVAFSPDGKTLATNRGVWDIATQTEIIPLGSSIVAFSPDGTTLAEAYRDGEDKDYKVKLWDIATRRNIATFEGHTGFITSIAFSPDGTTLASGSFDGTVKLWDIPSKDNVATINVKNRRNGWVSSVAFSPDGLILASGQRNEISPGRVKLWDVATRRNIATFEHLYGITSVAFSPDGTILASGSRDDTVKLWDIATRRNVATLEGHTRGVWSVAFSPDGAILASGSDDGTILLWDMSKWLAPRPTTLVKVSGDNQQGTSGAELTSPLVVELRDQYGSVLSLQGVSVTFTITTGDGKLGGRFTVENTTTDANGRAMSTLTLGPIAGTNTVEVSISGFDPVTFNAVGVGTPAIPIMGGDYQTWHLPKDAVVRLGKGAIGESDRAVDFSPDGQRLAVSSDIGVWLYEVATSQPLALLPTEYRVHSVVFSPDGTLLASGLNNGRVELWEVETGTKVAALRGHRHWVTSVVFSPDGMLLASGSRDQIIKLWDVTKSVEVGTYEVERKGYSQVSMSFSPDGAMLASGFQDGTVRLWDIATQTTIAELEGHVDYINSVAVSPDGTTLASGSRDRTIKLWDVATKRNIATFEGHANAIESVVFSPDGTMLASASGREIVLWDVATQTNIATLGGHTGSVESVSFSFDGTTLASGSTDGTVRLWDIKTRSIAILSGHMTLNSMAFSSDGMTLAAASLYEVVLWDVATRTNATLEGHRSWVNSVAFSPDGALLASGSTREVVLWDIATRTNATLEEIGVGAVSFSPNGAMLAAGSWGTVKLWDVATRTNIATFGSHANRIKSVVFSPDGTLLATGSLDKTVKLWDIATGTNIATLEGHTREVESVAFSPDGTLLATGSRDRTIKLWDVATRTNIATLEGGSVHALSFSPNGTILAAGSWGTVKLWNVVTRTEVVTFEGHTGWVESVVFSPDGKEIVSGAGDGTILLWDVSAIIPWPQTLVKVSGDKQQGVLRTPLENPLVVEVKDQNGNVLEGVAVTFSVTEGEGTLSVKTATTDSSGRVQAVLTLGNSLGTTIVAVAVAGIEQPATFVIIAISTPDFDGDGTVGFPDFLLFVEQFGLSREDEAYQVRFDLDGDGMIGFSDFLIFANAFGKKPS